MCDQISDAVLDDALRQDPNSRVAIETGTKNGGVMVFGEMTTRAYVDVPRIAREVLKDIGYTKSEYGIEWETASVWIQITEQSPNISQGVTEGEGLHKEQGAGDQGMMYGYATNETPEYMPLPITLAHKLTKKLADVRKSNGLTYLRPDGKSQVSVEYEDGKPIRATAVVVSCQHDPGISHEKIKEDITEKVIKPICKDWTDKETKIYVNPTGAFIRGGPYADAGCTGRTIIVDTYGGVGRHGGGAFCLAGNSLVNTEKGLLQIGECQEIGEKGLLVKTDVHPMPAGSWYDNGLKSTEILVSEDGYFLEATPNHQIRVIDKDGNYVWKLVENMQVGDFLSIQTKNRLFGNDEIPKFAYKYKEGTAEGRKKKYSLPTKLTEDYAYLLGSLIGDGDCTDEGCIRIAVCEKETQEIVQKLFEKISGDKGKIYGHWAYLGGIELRAFLKHLGLTYARSFEKTTPKVIFNASKNNCAAFLRGLFDTDGSIRLDGRNKNTKRIHLTTTSSKLAEQTQLLLLNFGIISTIYKTSVKDRIAYIKGRKINSTHARYDVVIKGSSSIQSFSENIGFNLSRKQKLLDITFSPKRDIRIIPHQKQRIARLFKKLPLEEQRKDVRNIGRFTRSSRGKATKELTYEKLKEFIDTYEKFLKDDADFIQLQKLFLMNHYYSPLKTKIPSFAHTYDLNIPFSHTFTANGFVVHNSGKDPTKVDRSAAYMVRYIAKNVVAAGLADRCEIQVAYAIGVADPVSIYIDCFGTNKIPVEQIEKLVRKHFSLKPADILKTLDLRKPIYRKTASYGHFGRDEFSWEKTDKAEILKQEAFGSKVKTAKEIAKNPNKNLEGKIKDVY